VRRVALTSIYTDVDYAGHAMERETRISAVISEATKELLERHVRATGMKKGHLVEQALRHHLQALQELPADVIIHPRIVVARRSAQALAKELERGTANDALRDLMRDGD
jgi:hypothetical protein